MMSRATILAGTGLYFALAFLITWLPLVPPSLAALGLVDGEPEDLMAGAPLAIFGPAIAAVIASAREGGRARVRALLSGLRAWRVGPRWYVLALTLPNLIYIAGRAVYGLIPGNDGGPWLYPPASAQAILGALLVPVGEEIGWRGYALPRLLERYGPLAASLVLGALWALWHLPMLLAVRTPPIELAIMIPYFLAGSVLFTWLYQRTEGSLLLAVLLHVGAHLHNPTHSDDPTPITIATLSLVAFAALLVAIDRRAFSRRSAA